MKTKQQHLESYQKRYFFGRKFIENLVPLGCGGIIGNILLILFIPSLNHSIEYVVVVGVVIMILASLVTTFYNIDDERDKVRKKLVLLTDERLKAEALFEENAEGKSPTELDAKQIALLKNFHALENKRHKKQAYLEMIGG